MSSVDHAWLATCPKGLEQLLAQELLALGAESTKETVAAVHFVGTRELAYRACLWSPEQKTLLARCRLQRETAGPVGLPGECRSQDQRPRKH